MKLSLPSGMFWVATASLDSPRPRYAKRPREIDAVVGKTSGRGASEEEGGGGLLSRVTGPIREI